MNSLPSLTQTLLGSSSVPTNYHFLPEETQKELKIIADTLVSAGKGILAADESVATVGRRFKEIGVENTEENRRFYRQLLFSTENLADSISGVIMFHETVFQKGDGEKTFLIDLLRERKIIPGIKVDKGVVPLYGTEDECTTQGLDDLGPRCEQYKKLGCHFAKWRCVLKIGPNTPSEQAIHENANVLARYASVCQAYRIVPIIEPEVLPDGHHNILRCQKVTEKVLAAVYKACSDHNVFLEGTILKSNMVTPGQSCKMRASPEEIGEATLITMQRTVPVSVSGIVFLSGGQTEEESTVNLNAINQCQGFKPWPLSFSFGRALQASALSAWRGLPENVALAQGELSTRVKANADASVGVYERSDLQGTAEDKNLFVANNEY